MAPDSVFEFLRYFIKLRKSFTGNGGRANFTGRIWDRANAIILRRLHRILSECNPSQMAVLIYPALRLPLLADEPGSKCIVSRAAAYAFWELVPCAESSAALKIVLGNI
jgi:hypothetical protein